MVFSSPIFLFYFLPVVLGLAFMGLVGIDLDPGTVMIGAIALGLVVDDSVHFLVRLRRRVAGCPFTDRGDFVQAARTEGAVHADVIGQGHGVTSGADSGVSSAWPQRGLDRKVCARQ